MSIRFIRVIFMCCIGCLFCCDAHCADKYFYNPSAVDKYIYNHAVSINSQERYNEFCKNAGVRSLYEQRCLEYENLSDEQKKSMNISAGLETASYRAEIQDVILKSIKKQVENKILFHNTCEDKTRGVCDKKTFVRTQVIRATAETLVKQSMDTDKIECYSGIKHVTNRSLANPIDDVLLCTRYDSNPHKYYSFVFDDLFETFDSTRYQSTAEKICGFVGGNIQSVTNLSSSDLSRGVVCNIDGTDDVVTKKCNLLNQYAEKHSFGAQTFVGRYSGKKKCEIIFPHEVWNKEKFMNKFGVDVDKFYSLEISATSELDFFSRRYIEYKMKMAGKKIKNFDFRGFRTVYTNDVNNPKDDLLTVFVIDDDDNEYYFYFRFDDVSECFKYLDNKGLGAFSCLLESGGDFDGKSCHGLDKTQCDELGARLRSEGAEGTKWDDEMGLCEIEGSSVGKGVEVVKKMGEYGGLAFGIAATVSNPITLTVAIIAGVAYVYADVKEAVAKNNISERVDKFIEAAKNCVECLKEEDNFCVEYAEKKCAIYLYRYFSHDLYTEYDSVEADTRFYLDSMVEKLLYSISYDLEELFDEEAFVKLKALTNKEEFVSEDEQSVFVAETIKKISGIVLVAMGKMSDAVKGAKDAKDVMMGIINNNGALPKVFVKIYNTVSKAKKLGKIAKVVDKGVKILEKVEEPFGTLGDITDSIDLVTESLSHNNKSYHDMGYGWIEDMSGYLKSVGLL